MHVPTRTVRTMDHTLEVRPLRLDEVPRVVSYFYDASDADLERMGVDKSKLCSRADTRNGLEAHIRTPPEEARAFYTAWLVDGEPIGFSSLKNIRHGERAEMHLHMWSEAHRGKGLGGVLFCLAALDGYERFRLAEIVCEPSAKNPMPNRMLQKAGFPLVQTYVGASSELSAVVTLNRYAVDRAVAAAYVRRHTQG